MEAKHQIINEESLISINEKVNKEQSSCYIKDLEYYWKEVITELNKASKWIANIEQVTLKDLKEFIFALYQSPELQKDVVTLVFSCNDEKYSPKGN
ncbi:unnamed protein product [Rhizophagus irregularis]|nr:unnamed protein product [Rhizophagus irregularis]